MQPFQRQYFQRFLIPLVNATVNGELVAHAQPDYRLSFVALTDADKEKWHSDPCVKCLIGSFKYMLDKASSAILLECDEGGDALADDDVGNALGSLFGLLDVRLPYVLWTPFGEKRLHSWRVDDFKIVPLGNQKIPREHDSYATLNVDDATFRRYWAEIFDASDTGLRLRRALGRHRHARVSMYREDAIMNSFIGLETLFGDQVREIGKIPARVGKRVARYILDPDVSPSVADLVGLSNRVRELYEARHAIVHGADPTNLSTEEAAFGSMQLLSVVLNIALEEGFERLADRKGLAKRFDDDMRAARRLEKQATRHRKKQRD